MEDAVLLLRYHRWDEEKCSMRFEGFGRTEILDLICEGTPMTQLEVPIGTLRSGEHSFSVELTEGCGLVLEGFALMPKSETEHFKVKPATHNEVAKVKVSGPQMQLTYDDWGHTYSIEVPQELSRLVRQVRGEDVPAVYNRYFNDRVHPRLEGIGDRESVLISLGPIPLAPGTSKQFRFKVGLAGAAIEKVPEFEGNFDSDAPFAFGMERLAATALTNLVFPVHHRDGYVRHNSPGRQWDSLYTWDSGMIGVGMAAVDIERAKGCLHQYLLPEDDPHAAFVEHGTPLPIQAEVAGEVWEQTEDHTWLREVYPKLRNFYEWLAGRSRGSTTDRFKTGLLQTWDYNYNSGGWDDYPPQWELHDKPELRRQITPCVTTAYAIRFAKQMEVFSAALNQSPQPYAEDIERWSAALEQAWDEDSGYYGYLMHDDLGNPAGIYRHQSGENYNRGLDGIYPLVTGELSEERRARLLEKLFDARELWTPWGANTVASSAAYYSTSGYWNGAVWMPHQYVIWKALREQKLDKAARKLAKAVLNCWERETQATYHCFELFRSDTGRGSGWHQFSALSTPLLMIAKKEFQQPCFSD